MHVVQFVCLFVVASVGLPSQNTLVVGPGGFAQIRDAVSAAAPNDIVVVQPGSYWNFTVDKGLTIRAAQPGTVEVGFDAATPQVGYTIFAAPASQPIDVIGIRFAPSIIVWPIIHRVEVRSGRVRFDGCEMRARGTVLVVEDAEVAMQSCLIQEVDPIVVQIVVSSANAILSVTDSQVLGAVNAPPMLFSLGSAIDAQDSAVHIANSTVRGNAGSAGGIVATAAISGVNSPGVWATDSQLLGGNGACPLLMPVQVGRCTLSSSSATCLANALPMLDPISVGRPAPPSIGASFTLEFDTEPNGFVAVLAADDSLANGIPLTEQPGQLDPVSLRSVALVLTDANGEGSITWSIPNQPSLIDAEIWLQGVGGTSLALPLQATTAVGGVLR